MMEGSIIEEIEVVVIEKLNSNERGYYGLWIDEDGSRVAGFEGAFYKNHHRLPATPAELAENIHLAICKEYDIEPDDLLSINRRLSDVLIYSSLSTTGEPIGSLNEEGVWMHREMTREEVGLTLSELEKRLNVH